MSSSRTPSRRQFLTTSAAAAVAATIPAKAQNQPQAPTVSSRKKPLNVLFFMSDDMRAELGCYASRFHTHSPNIDKLASQGVRFDRNFCQFPLCNPSRASMFSGHPPHTTKVLGNRDGVCKLHPDWVTLPRLFRDSGYNTFRAGKLFHAGLDDPKAWTEFYGDVESLHPTQVGTKMDIPHTRIPMPNGVLPVLPADNQRAAHSDQLLILTGNGEGASDYMVADLAIQYLQKCAKDSKPFFVGCGFSKPHSPPTAPQRFFDMYDPAKITLPPDFAAWPTVPPGFPPGAIRMRNADLFIGRGASESESKEVIRAYLASISWADWNLGRVLGELDKLGLRDNTLIVFVVDHGYQLGEKGKWSKAGSLFENGTRIPLIISMPGMHGNGRPSLRIVQSLNVYRTVAELAGLDVPSEIEGISMVPLLKDPRAPWEHPAYSIWSEDGSTVHGTMVRTEQFRYAEFGPPADHARAKQPSEYAMLFDVHADPMEITNLADHPGRQKTREQLSRLINDYSYPA